MKISKLTSSSLVIIAVFILNLWTSAANAQSACTAASDASTLTTGAGDNWAQCKSTPDAMKLKFYKMALCTSKPTFSDDSTCVYLLNTTTSVEAEISVGGTTNLISGDVSIPEGTYPYAMLLIDTTIGIKKTLEFNTGNEQYDGLGNQGKYCWTNGNPVTWGYAANANYPITCGSTPTPAFSYETFIAYGEDAPTCVVNKVLNEQTSTTKFDIYLLHDLNTAADVAHTNCMPTIPANNKAKYMWGVQTFNTPPVISANTQRIDMGFKLTDGINVSLNAWQGNCNAGAGNECVESANIMSFAFTMATE